MRLIVVFLLVAMLAIPAAAVGGQSAGSSSQGAAAQSAAKASKGKKSKKSKQRKRKQQNRRGKAQKSQRATTAQGSSSSSATADEVEVKGPIASLSPLTVGTTSCVVPAGFSLAGFAVGDVVEMTCDLVGGQWVLRKLELEDAPQGEVEVKGVVSSLSPLTVAGVSCVVPAGTSLTGIAVGDVVEMECALVGGQWVVTDVELEDDDNSGTGNGDDDGDNGDDDGDNSGSGGGDDD